MTTDQPKPPHLRNTHRVRLTWLTTGDLPSEAYVRRPGGYLEVDGWRLTYDPLDDEPWTLWHPETAEGVRDEWRRYERYEDAIREIREQTRCYMQKDPP